MYSSLSVAAAALEIINALATCNIVLQQRDLIKRADHLVQILGLLLLVFDKVHLSWISVEGSLLSSPKKVLDVTFIKKQSVHLLKFT